MHVAFSSHRAFNGMAYLKNDVKFVERHSKQLDMEMEMAPILLV